MATGEELAEEITESVNSGIDSDELTDIIGNEHRYLQSEVFKQVIKPIICEYARLAEAEHYDGRNKQTVLEAKEIADAMGWYY